MYKNLRIYIPGLIIHCRWHASQRSLPNHYETLRIDKNSSQKEIRDAFIQLSKKLHPDVGGKGSHAEFVKVNEAYDILSKDHSRRVYDHQLYYKNVTTYDGTIRNPMQRQYYGFHNDPAEWAKRMEEASQRQDYYGFNGCKRVSNGKIALVCVIFCLCGIVVQYFIIRYSFQRSKNRIRNQNIKIQEAYRKVRMSADGLTREEQIASLKDKIIQNNTEFNVGPEQRD